MKKTLSSTLRTILFTSIILLSNNILAQSEVIYTEYFTGQSGKGVSGTTSNLNGVDWSVNVSQANLMNYNDYIKVGTLDGSEVMFVKDLNGFASWYSPIIDISDHSEVRVYLKAMTFGGSGHNSGDYFRTYYRINSGSWVQLESDGNLTGTFGEKWPGHDNLNGNTLQIRVQVKNNNGNDDRFAFDNVTMKGIPKVQGVSCGGDATGATQFTESFDTPGDWTGNIATGQTNGYWNFGMSGATPSGSTGPNGGQSGDYMYYESSLNANGGNTSYALASTPLIDLSASEAGDESELSFYMHAYGSGMGYFRVSFSSQEFGPWTQVFKWDNYHIKNTSSNSGWVQIGLDVSDYSGGNLYVKFEYTGSGSFRGDFAIDTMRVISCEKPVITEGNDISAIEYPEGSGPSGSGSSTVSGTSLEANITATASNYFQISTDDSSFSDTITLSQAGGTVNQTDIYARLIGDLAFGDYSGTIVITSPNAATKTISLSGSVNPQIFTNTSGDNYWQTASNWSSGSVPTLTTTATIPSGKSVIVGTSVSGEIQNIIVESGASLSILGDSNLTVFQDFTNTGGSLTLNSSSNEFASIIVEGTATGNITYNRFVNYQAYQEWDIIGPPVLNQNMQSFAQTNTNNNNANNTGSLAFDDPYYALGRYLTEWGSWSNYTTSTIPNANFPVAKGYQMATNAVENNSSLEGQSLTFTGEIATTTQTINIQNQNGANGGYGRRWNLVANPFPSYLNGNTNAGAQNFIDINEGVIDSSYLAIYAWKADATDGTGWHTFNRLNTNNDDGTLFIAPGQAFFVAAASTDVAQIQFTPSMRTVTGGDDFINGAPVLLNYKLDLKLYNGSAERAKTKFHFQQGLTLGLNPGYDAGAYDQAAALSSRLPEDDQGVNFQLNAMSIEAAYNQTIPLVINQQEGQSFRVSISNNTLPENVYVYLEDVLNGTLTSLKDQDFELIAQEDLSQDGRFYIRFTTQNLTVNDVLSPSSLTIFKLNTDAFVTIQGLTPEMGKTTATLYNMLGMKVREKALDSSQSAQRISTQGLASGVYIIKLKAGEQGVSKKIIIQ